MLHLVPFTEDDIGRLMGWVDSREVFALWTASTFDYPLTRERFLRHMEESAARGDRLIFKVVDAGSGEAIGHVELGAIDRTNASLRIGRVLLAPAARGRGLGAELMRAALRKAFGEMGMYRVELGVFDVNQRAIACYEGVGFRREGVKRDTLRVPPGYWSEVVMSILAPEWEALQDRTTPSPER